MIMIMIIITTNKGMAIWKGLCVAHVYTLVTLMRENKDEGKRNTFTSHIHTAHTYFQCQRLTHQVLHFIFHTTLHHTHVLPRYHSNWKPGNKGFGCCSRAYFFVIQWQRKVDWKTPFWGPAGHIATVIWTLFGDGERDPWCGNIDWWKRRNNKEGRRWREWWYCTY